MTFSRPNYDIIRSFIQKNSKRPVKVIAVSKNHPKNSIDQAINLGLRVFGENRVQEAFLKFNSIKGVYKDLELHLTGSLQKNKVKLALEVFDFFHTLDRESLAREFVKHSKSIKTKKFFIQINTGKEITKSGVYPEDANDFINFCKFDLNIPIYGLMCIPPIDVNPHEHFNLLKKLAFENNIDNLSMGMSGDYEQAIICGATHIRVGTKLFGKRNAP